MVRDWEIFVVLKECFGISCPAICAQNSADDSLAFTSICYWAKTFIPSASCEAPLCIFSEAEPVLMWKNKQRGKQPRTEAFKSPHVKFPLSSCARIPRGICTHKSPLAYIWHTQRALCLAHCPLVLQHWLQTGLQTSLKKFLCNQETQNLTEFVADILYGSGSLLPANSWWSFCSLALTGLSKEVLYILGK